MIGVMQIYRIVLETFRGHLIVRSMSSIGGISPSSFLFLRGRTRARGCAVQRVWRKSDADKRASIP
jgi:hypothetical protein